MKYYVRNMQGELVQVKHETLYDTRRSATQPEVVQTKFCHFYYGHAGRMYAVMQGPQLWPVFDDLGFPISDSRRVYQVWNLLPTNEKIEYSYTE